jgi:hypothetical protein
VRRGQQYTHADELRVRAFAVMNVFDVNIVPSVVDMGRLFGGFNKQRVWVREARAFVYGRMVITMRFLGAPRIWQRSQRDGRARIGALAPHPDIGPEADFQANDLGWSPGVPRP